jgi:Sulfotransferase family
MIMVMGLPRSGTTWLGKIFDSHPDTYYSHEPDSAAPLRDVPLLIPEGESEALRSRLVAHVERLRHLRTCRVLGKLPLFPKSYRGALPLWASAQELIALKALSRAFGNVPVPRHVSGNYERASAWVWKSIESSGRLGALLDAFPESRAIFIVRHPCGVAASLLRGESETKFSSGPASEDYGFFDLLAATEQARSHGLTADRFRSMSPVDRVAWRWALLNEKTLDDISSSPRCRIVRYEDLCDRPEDVGRELFAFVGLPWQLQTERFVSASTSRDEGSYYGVFKDPRLAANKWKEQLSPPVSDRILEIASRTNAGRMFAVGTSTASREV